MRSVAARITIGAVAWIALGLAAFFLIRSQQHITSLRASVRAFDLHARETTDALADLRAGQQAYVAAGQDAAFWMPKVATTTAVVRETVLSLRQVAASGPARAALLEAESTVAEFDAVDKRAREYLNAGDRLMAADVIFMEGETTARAAARDVESARLAEHQAFDASEAEIRRQQASALGAAAGFAALMILVLAVAGSTAAAAEPEATTSATTLGKIVPAVPVVPVPRSQASTSRTAPILKTAAELCTDFGRVRDLRDVRDLLARTAEVMDASGLVVWLGSTTGTDLQPIVSHGYSPQTVARMPAVARSADNAAAAAYRTGMLQIVLSRPGGASGALVAPLLAADGCIGALSAEIRNGGEGSEGVQALASIFAAHLASIFVATASETAAQKTAAQA